MSEKREFPILNGKLLSDLDLNGHKLLGQTLPEGGGGGGGGGGSSVDVVAPSPNGAGKAADAKAVYEGLEGKLDKLDVVNPTEEAKKGQAADAKDVSGHLSYLYSGLYNAQEAVKHKQDALNDGQMAAVNSGIDAEWVSEQARITRELQQETRELQQTSTYQAGLIDGKIPLYINLSPVEVDGVLHLYPFGRNEVSTTLEAIIVAEVLRNTSDNSVSFGSGIMLDCSLVIDCRDKGTAPTITWPVNFHPRTNAETDFACVAGVRNVYWITEHAEGEFCVAGWQVTTGGDAK